jgi:hypothetical protein
VLAARTDRRWVYPSARRARELRIPGPGHHQLEAAATLERNDQQVNRDELLHMPLRWPPPSTSRSTSTPSGGAPTIRPAHRCDRCGRIAAALAAGRPAG